MQQLWNWIGLASLLWIGHFLWIGHHRRSRVMDWSIGTLVGVTGYF